jgi:hypothetical protein
VLHFEDAAPDEELAGDGLQTIQSDMPASKALTKMTNKKKNNPQNERHSSISKIFKELSEQYHKDLLFSSIIRIL